MAKKTKIIIVVLAILLAIAAGIFIYLKYSSSKQVEAALSDYYSIQGSDRGAEEEGLQSISKRDEKEGVVLEVLQAFTYENIICISVDISFADTNNIMGKEAEIIPENVNILSGDQSIISTSKAVELVGTNIESSTMTYLLWFYSDDVSIFAKNTSITLSIDAFSVDTETVLQFDEPLSVSWDVQKIGSSTLAKIDNENISGDVIITPISLHFNLVAPQYSSLDSLLRDIKLQDKDASTIDVLGRSSGSFDGSDGEYKGTILFSSFLPIDRVDVLIIGELQQKLME